MKKRKKKLILSSKVSTKFANDIKLISLRLLLAEYKRVLQLMVDLQWEDVKPQSYIEEYPEIDTWLSQRMIQCCWKQANGIVKGTRQKQQRREYIYEQLIEKGHTRKARKLKKTIDDAKITKPNIKNAEMELDSRFVQIDLDNTSSFDGWLTLTSLGNKMKIQIPFKRTKHFNKMMESGTIKDGVRLSEKFITFNFFIKDLPKIESPIKPGIKKGMDVGIDNPYSLSTGEQGKQDKDGWTMKKVAMKMARKKKGSKAYEAAQNHRDNFLGWTLNQINYEETNCLVVERLYRVGSGTRQSKMLQRWAYRQFFDLLERKCELNDVQLIRTSPTYTSQRCCLCGWVRKGNRKGSEFTCDRCGNHMDSDVNASRNIVLTLPAVRGKERLSRMNKKGFYWYRDNFIDDDNRISFLSEYLVQEPIVPGTHEVSDFS
jgi:transposase